MTEFENLLKCRDGWEEMLKVFKHLSIHERQLITSGYKYCDYELSHIYLDNGDINFLFEKIRENKFYKKV